MSIVLKKAEENNLPQMNRFKINNHKIQNLTVYEKSYCLTVEAQSKRNYVLETRDIGNFDELNIEGGFTVHLMACEDPFIEIEAHKKDVENVKVSVRSGRLYVSQRNKVKKIKPITLHEV